MMTSEDRYSYGYLRKLNTTIVVVPYKVSENVGQSIQRAKAVVTHFCSVSRATVSVCTFTYQTECMNLMTYFLFSKTLQLAKSGEKSDSLAAVKKSICLCPNLRPSWS